MLIWKTGPKSGDRRFLISHIFSRKKLNFFYIIIILQKKNLATQNSNKTKLVRVYRE